MPWYDGYEIDGFAAGTSLPIAGVDVIARGALWPDTDREDDFVLRCAHDREHLRTRMPRRHEQNDASGSPVMEMVECTWCERAVVIGQQFGIIVERITRENLMARARRYLTGQ